MTSLDRPVVTAMSCLQAPGSVIVLVATHVDKLSSTSDVQQRLQDIMYSVKDAECRAVENVKAELHSLQSVSCLFFLRFCFLSHWKVSVQRRRR